MFLNTSVNFSFKTEIMASPNAGSPVQEEHPITDKPAWLDNFLQRNDFFDSCSLHQRSRNDLNKYCINCDAALCQYCESSTAHSSHNMLKLYRHVYQNSVPVNEIKQHIDCSSIQVYKCNGLLVISLYPLPHQGCGLHQPGSACVICTRILHDARKYCYCSLSCKVEAFMRKEKSSDPPFLELGAGDEYAADEREGHAVDEREEEEDKDDEDTDSVDEVPVSLRKRKRKGVPCRAPFH